MYWCERSWLLLRFYETLINLLRIFNAVQTAIVGKEKGSHKNILLNTFNLLLILCLKL